MKVHKIPNVDKHICCCEQKIAANIAFRLSFSFKDTFDTLVKKKCSQIGISEFISRIRREGMKWYEWTGEKRYNVDAIDHALRTGLESYMRMNIGDQIRVESGYDIIGKTFPILYDIE